MNKIYDLIIVNWKSTTKAIVPLLAALVAKFGYDLDTETVTLVLSFAYTLLLMFSKDHKEVQP